MGFRTILVGFIFIFFNINLGEVNILPDVVGYILLFIGSNILKSKLDNDFFSVVKTSSLILIFLSFLDLLIKHSDVLNGVINNTQAIQGKVFSLIFYFTIISLLTYCLYNLCKGIEKEANGVGKKELATKARKGFVIFAVYQFFFFIFFLVGTIVGKQEASFNGGGAIFIFIVVGIVMIYVIATLFSLLNQAEKTFLAGINR
jgi:hypothetical protein